ncbi:class I SAM-dependent methyltransferase [Microbacterium aquimaris]|uniref:Methyltransferase domain-containing protein n=1 Tax=Microbacterium aquimaris TaxID=459816 RepID=A0ABU5N2M0_9MICO|nr:class I SAM-dependent methyltransferase [Microbacterium aquimaris]MDZ8160333.1 methyltransferase domain-containing protein [Microbacterium aquimaris]
MSTAVEDERGGASEVDAFAEKVMAAALGWVDLMAIHLGSQMGWYDALAKAGPMDAEELAVATGTSRRYAQEWLEQQSAAGILEVDDPAGPRVRLAAGAAEVLTDRGSLSYLEPLARMFAASGAQMPRLVEAYRSGSGVSWEEFGDHARQSQADMNRPWFDALPEVIRSVDGLHALLSRPGARIADIGSGAGWSSLALAHAYPQAAVDGFDVDDASIEMSRENAAAAGLGGRVRFERADAADLAAHGPFDVIFAFECLHDMPHPVDVLAAARDAVAPGGAVVVMDEAAAETFSPDAGALERLLYGFSLFICLPDGLSHPGSAGTGTVMRHDTLREYAREAGWGDVEIIVPEFGLWRIYALT